jgi:nucleoid-associated protein
MLLRQDGSINLETRRLPNDIINLTVHEHRRIEGRFEVRLRGAPLPVNPLTQKVVDDLHELYRRRSSKAHGRFAADAVQFPTQTFVQAYMNAGATADAFATLTGDLMTTLDVRARARPNAGGGHVLFAHFETEGRQFLLVAIVNEKWGARLTQDLDLREAPHIDMEGFRFAGRIGISGWLAGEARYIGFLKGRGNVAEYFKEVLGCEETVLEKADTQGLVDIFRDFADSRNLIGEPRENFMRRARSICERSARARTELNFTALANELVPEAPADLLDRLNDPERNLTDGFVPNAAVLTTLVRFKARTDDWTIEFDRNAITNEAITFNQDDETLVIHDLPEQLVARLRQEFGLNAEA